jgi:hypothetical protein
MACDKYLKREKVQTTSYSKMTTTLFTKCKCWSLKKLVDNA